jgi:hypothetical protein
MGNTSPIDVRLRFQALYAARRSCENCGKSIDTYGIALVVVHKVPLEFGGLTEPNNLWALCEECNGPRMNCFSRMDADWIRRMKETRSVHLRLGEILKVFQSEPVPTAVLKCVANQDDWKKRLRELRYLGWEIETFNRRVSSTRVSSFYRLVKSRPWPADPTGDIRRYERERAVRNKA